MIDVESLLQETAEQPPCGPDLEYDAAFRDLEQAAQGKPEQQFGDTVVAAEEPAWAQVRESALTLLQRSKDLRIAALLVRALVQTEGFAGLLPGLRLILRLLERYWDTVYPLLDAEDDNDPTMRINALAPLVDGEALIRDLRATRFMQSRQDGQVTVRDIEVALGRMPARKGAEAVSQRQIDAILASVAREDAAALARVGETLAETRALANLLNDKVGPERAPDFKPLMVILSMLNQVVRGAVGDGAAAGDATGPVPEAESVSAPAGGAGERPMNVEIRTREEALLMIDKIISYFERNEPTNPAPLLIKRARRLVSMNFVDIIKDMAPESLKQIESIAGPGRDG